MTERELEQEKAINSLLLNLNKNNLVLATMRFGKTRVIFEFLKRANINNILVIVPKKIHKTQWEIEKYTWRYEGNIFVITYSSLHKLHKQKYLDKIEIIILDEIQNLTSTKYELIKNILKEYKLIGLTGTLPREYEKRAILNELNFNIAYKLNIVEAIRKNIVRDFNITIVYVNFGEDLVKKRNKNGKFYTIKEKDLYDYFSILIERLGRNKELAIKRANIIYNSKSKIEPTKNIIEYLKKKNERFLIFTKRIEKAKIYSENVITQDKRKELEKIVKNFNEGIINNIASVNMIAEGITLRNIDAIIFEQVDSNEGNLLQRLGRALLIENSKQEPVKVIIMCTENTVEKNWIKKSIPKNINITEVKYNNIKQKLLNYEKN